MSVLHVIQLGRMTVTFIMSERQTRGYLDAFEVALPANGRIIVPHRHPDFDETVIGLDGITSWTVDGVIKQIGPGEQLLIPRDAEHGFFNPSSKISRFMCILTPGKLGPDYFQEIAIAMAGDAPIDYADICAIMTRYGVIPVAMDQANL